MKNPYISMYLDSLKKYIKEQTVRFIVLLSLGIILLWGIITWIIIVIKSFSA